jgi:hypothetical protein
MFKADVADTAPFSRSPPASAVACVHDAFTPRSPEASGQT